MAGSVVTLSYGRLVMDEMQTMDTEVRALRDIINKQAQHIKRLEIKCAVYKDLIDDYSVTVKEFYSILDPVIADMESADEVK